MEISQLKEEEIIEDAKEYIKNIKELLNNGNNDMSEDENINFYTLQVVIQGLLDLYNKEKEKNKELQNYMKEYLIPKSTINLIYISKDKIKQKIEELNEEFDYRNCHEEDFNYNYGENYAFAEEKIKELLEE